MSSFLEITLNFLDNYSESWFKPWKPAGGVARCSTYLFPMRSPGSHPPFRGFPLSTAPTVSVSNRSPAKKHQTASVVRILCQAGQVHGRFSAVVERKSLDRPRLIKILEEVKEGRLLPEEASCMFQDLQTEDLGFACVDHHRAVRLGFPEVIFGQGKTVEQIVGIFKSLQARQDTVLITRVDDDKAREILREDFRTPTQC